MRLRSRSIVLGGPGLVAIVAFQIVVVFAYLVSITGGRLNLPAYQIDLDVYRQAAGTLLHGGSLYDHGFPVVGQLLPFTYPPFAAIVMSPLGTVPYGVACLGMSVITVGLLGVVVAVVLRSQGALPTGRHRWLVFGLVLLLADVIEPVHADLVSGQVGALLMAVVVLDVLVERPLWPRGMLIGLAAAIKLTPAVFVLYFLLRRDRRAAVVSGLSFVAATGVGALLAPDDSHRYWTGLFFDDGRVGGPGYVSNQSLLGMLTRLGLPASQRFVWWAILVAVVVVLAILGMRRALAAGQPVFALGVNAIAGLLVSPISWTHHWVWMVVVLPGWAVLGLRTRHRGPLVLAGSGLLLMLVVPLWWGPHDGTVSAVEGRWDIAWWPVTSNCYALYAVLLLVISALPSTFRLPRPDRAALTGTEAVAPELTSLATKTRNERPAGAL